MTYMFIYLHHLVQITITEIFIYLHYLKENKIIEVFIYLHLVIQIAMNKCLRIMEGTCDFELSNGSNSLVCDLCQTSEMKFVII